MGLGISHKPRDPGACVGHVRGHVEGVGSFESGGGRWCRGQLGSRRGYGGRGGAGRSRRRRHVGDNGEPRHRQGAIVEDTRAFNIH